MVDDDVEVGPGAELALPVGDGGEWGDDEEGPFDAHAVDLLQEGDGLDGLSQAHLVCQDAVPSEESRQQHGKENLTLMSDVIGALPNKGSERKKNSGYIERPVVRVEKKKKSVYLSCAAKCMCLTRSLGDKGHELRCVWERLKTKVMELRGGGKEGGGGEGGDTADEKEVRTMEGENYIISNHNGASESTRERRRVGGREVERQTDRGKNRERKRDRERDKERVQEREGRTDRQTDRLQHDAGRSVELQLKCLSRRRPVGGGIMS